MTHLPPQDREFFANLARQVPGVIYQYRLFPDGRSCFPYASEAIREIYEVAPDDVREDASPAFARGHPDDVPRVVEAISRSAETLETWACEYRVILPVRGVRWLRGLANPERLPDGSTLWHGFITDITDLRRLQEQLAQAAKMETIGRLAGGVAHDFNNLLTVITGHLGMAREQLAPGSPLDAELAEAERAAASATALTQQLLTFSRRQAIAPVVLDPAAAVRGVEGMLRRLLGEAVTLRVECADGAARVRFDPNQLEQVLVNLAVNARDAMAAGGTVTIETEEVSLDEAGARAHPEVPPGRYVRLAVHDTGAGIPDAMRGHLFEPFYTTKEAGRGTGLGLAMVHGAVTQNGGRIEVASAAGHGTTFALWLPAVDDAPTARPAPAVAVSPRGSETIALVEDEPAIRALAARILRNQGYTVREFEHGRAALEALRDPTVPLDLLVTDVIMPELDGRQLADRLRAERPGVRVLFVSGYTEDVIAHHGVLDGGVDFLAKPYSAALLARRAREALDRPADP